MKKQTRIIVAFLFLSIVALSYSFIIKNNPNPPAPVVRISSGLISGTKSGIGEVTSYKGIPFAAPPVNELRWKAPKPAKPWKGVKKCEAYGPSPMQSKPVPFGVYTSEFLIPEKPISEDCLYLNVWTNARSKADKKPVLVWIYGGAFLSGGSAVPIYDGEAMAKKGVIFVSINYRVGIFGYLAHPELTKESPDHVSGNYGLLDQIAALRWIKQNIAAFGGDPDNVTIDGQSAGSMSVNYLVASPLAKGLFNKAIAESGSKLIDNPATSKTTLQDGEEQGEKLVKFANAGTFKEFRAMPAEALQKLQGRFSPLIDGFILPESIPQIFAEGKENHVPVLTGWNADEAFVSEFKKKDEFIKQAREQYGADADEFLKYYPANNEEQAIASQITLNRDFTFALSGYKWGATQSRQGKSPIYLYYFELKVPATPAYQKYGAFHTAEVAYALGNLKFLNRPFQPSDFKLADLMSSYWANFAKTGNPNGNSLPFWPKYNTSDNTVMIFNECSASGKLPGAGGLDFLLSRLPQ